LSPRGSPRLERQRLRRAAAAILAAGLRAVAPGPLVRRELRRLGLTRGTGRLVVIAAGKAAPGMAAAAEAVLGDAISGGLVVSNEPGPRSRLERHLASHPLPGASGLRAADEVRRWLTGLEARDSVLVLLSGGASAMLPAPVPGVSLQDKARTTALLLRSGAPIAELNTVRKHLSLLKGGGLVRAASPARVVSLLLSDVVGDDPSLIASGPTVADPTTFADALQVLRERGVLGAAPPSVRRHLLAGVRGGRAETPKPGDPLFRRTLTRVIGGARLGVAAAAREARRQGLRPVVLTTRLQGEAREAAGVLVSILRECVEHAQPAAPPVALLAAGETTVTVRGAGRGGRNQELALAAARALDGFPAPATVASLGTDGIDGKSDAAGGVADDASARRARGLGLLAIEDFQARSDSQAFLAPLGDLILTGPTGTNVGDLVVLLASRGVR
jgi:hydroxypyruvate reductase